MDDSAALLLAKYDVAVVGKSLGCAIVAGACARAGKKVIHLSGSSEMDADDTLTLREFGRQNSSATNKFRMELSDQQTAAQDQEYRLDFFPRILYANGTMITSLVNSKVANYVTARMLSATYFLENDQWIKVPGSRSDIFTSAALSLDEKRLLMKFITSCDSLSLVNGGSLSEFLETEGWSKRLVSLCIYGLLLYEDSKTHQLSTEIAATQIRQHMHSLGKFGPNNVFLYPTYGTNDIVQAFQRYAALSGVIQTMDYCQVKEIDYKNSMWQLSGTKNLGVSASHLVTTPENSMKYLPRDYPIDEFSQITYSRAIICMNTSFSVDQQSCLYVIPPGIYPHPHPYFILQLDGDANVCPSGQYIAYLWTKKNVDAEKDLDPVLCAFFKRPDVKIHFSVFIEQSLSICKDKMQNFSNSHVLNDPITPWDMEKVVHDSKIVYSKIVQNETENSTFLLPIQDSNNE